MTKREELRAKLDWLNHPNTVVIIEDLMAVEGHGKMRARSHMLALKNSYEMELRLLPLADPGDQIDLETAIEEAKKTKF